MKDLCSLKYLAKVAAKSCRKAEDIRLSPSYCGVSKE